MAAIDISTRAVVSVELGDSTMDLVVFIDETDSKQYVMTIDAGVLKFTNIADDSEVLSFTKDV